MINGDNEGLMVQENVRIPKCSILWTLSDFPSYAGCTTGAAPCGTWPLSFRRWKSRSAAPSAPR